jgi:phytoene dehydrogenase-like protein
MPMPAADLVGEWFESEPLRATIAAGGILGSFLGPWSAGSAAVLLLLAAGEGHPIASGWFVVGGPGALADALAAAARQAGAEIRTGAEVARIEAANGAASGVTLSTGETIAARAVVSNADPKRTLLGLLDPTHLDPEFVRASRTSAPTARSRRSTTPCRRCRVSPASRRSADRADRGAVGTHPLAANIDGIERAFDAAKYGSSPTSRGSS